MDGGRQMCDWKEAKTGENEPGKDTHPRNDGFIHDVNDLMSCINLWKKEGKHDTSLTKLENFVKLAPLGCYQQPPSRGDKDFKPAGGGKQEAAEATTARSDRPDGGDAYESLQEMDDNRILTELNYPIELDYDKVATLGRARKGDFSGASTDTRYGTEYEASNRSSRGRSGNTENSEPGEALTLDYRGKNIDPQNTLSKIYNRHAGRSESWNGPDNAEHNPVNFENENLRSTNAAGANPGNIKGNIGELFGGENYRIPGQIDAEGLKRLNEETRFEGGYLEGDGVLVGDNGYFRDAYDEELENEENPLISLITQDTPMITERDILGYGKSDSNLSVSLGSADRTPVEPRPNVIKDASISSQIDQILSKKEEEAEPEKIRGVCYCKSDNSWTAWWTEKGKSRKKAFKLSLYGYEEARRRAIQHRLQIEELMPELKERRARVPRKKPPQTPMAEPPTPALKAPGLEPQPEPGSGIYRGTRTRSREDQSQGIYFLDNAWHATWFTSQGQRVTRSFPVKKELPYIAARNKATSAFNLNAANAAGALAQADPLGYGQAPNAAGPAAAQIYKRQRLEGDEIEGARASLDHFRNLERKLDAEISRSRLGAGQAPAPQLAGHVVSQITSSPQIYMQSVQEFRVPAEEPAEPARPAARFNSLHCQIKLEKSILDEIQRAINKSLAQGAVQHDGAAREPLAGDAGDRETEPTARSLESAATAATAADEAGDKNFKSVTALCISQADSARTTSISILPTYIRGPQDSQLLTFVILNS